MTVGLPLTVSFVSLGLSAGQITLDDSGDYVNTGLCFEKGLFLKNIIKLSTRFDLALNESNCSSLPVFSIQ